MKIKTGQYDVHETGTVIGFEENNIEFQIAPNMTILFIFKTDETIPEHKVKIDIIDETLNLTFFNFHSPVGVGNIKPLPIGRLNNRQLYLNYRIYSLKDKKVGKSVHYTFYLGEEASNG